MGMFDWVHFEMDCPECGQRVGGFQTKDRALPSLDTLEVKDIDNFYSSCDGCGAWIEFTRKRPPGDDIAAHFDRVVRKS